MSRIGNKVVVIPEGVTVTQDGNNVTVKGPKGELTRTFSSDITMNIEGNEVTFTRPNDSKEMKTIHGTTRANFNNMVVGVTTGFSKSLEIAGVGYRAAKQGNNINFTLGFSHPVVKEPPAGITFEVPAPNKIVVSGADKEKVGAVAAEIRTLRPPEPYKGKGIRYEGEYVRRKMGKAGAKGKK